MITLDFDQAADFFGTGPVPANYRVMAREDIDRELAALLAA